MNRKMFQVGGTVTYADGRTDNISIEDFTQQISALSDADLFALRNSADAGQIFISPELKTILDSVTDRKSIPITQRIGRQASISSLKDVGRILKGLYLPAISGLTRQIFSEEQLANMPAVRSVAEYDSPFYGEGISGFRETAQRGGRSAEELAAILQPSIQDFSEEVDEISMPQEIQDEVVEPITRVESETLGQPTDTLEAEKRRREYEASLVGRDEFGEILPESRLIPELPTEDQNEIDSLIKEITPIETTVNINKTEEQSKAENLVKFEPPELKLTKVDTEALEERDIAKPPPVVKETTGIFGSDRFLDFIRNVGGQLVSTGQLGEGLAAGAAKAAEERAARDLLEEQEKKKFERELLIAGVKAAGDDDKDIMKADKILELSDRLNTDIGEFQGGLAATGFVDLAIETIEEAQARGESVGGVFGLANALIDKGFAAIGMGKDFENLSAQEKVNKLVQVVRQKNLQAILGESGRTISDKDRAIILEVFGDLSVFEDPSITLGKLRESRRGLADENAARKRRIESGSDFLRQQGTYGQQFYSDLLPSLSLIKDVDPLSSQSLLVLQRIIGQMDPEKSGTVAGVKTINLTPG
jgi:hypothetical protein